MPFALSAIPWRLLAAIGIAAGVFYGAMFVVGTIKRAATSEALLKSSLAIGNANAELAKSQAVAGKRIDAVATLAAIRKAQIRAASDERRKAINNAPAENDAPLAPVLREQLNRLPEHSAGSNSSRKPAGPVDPATAFIADARPD